MVVVGVVGRAHDKLRAQRQRTRMDEHLFAKATPKQKLNVLTHLNVSFQVFWNFARDPHDQDRKQMRQKIHQDIDRTCDSPRDR